MLNYKYLISWSTALDFGTMFEFKIEKAGCYRESWLHSPSKRTRQPEPLQQYRDQGSNLTWHQHQVVKKEGWIVVCLAFKIFAKL